MNQNRVAVVTRSMTSLPCRRDVVRGLLGAGLGLGAARLPGSMEAKKRRKPKRKQPRLNAFGCVDVGQPCRGDDRLCCSGICQGKKPKQGQKDRTRCVGHDSTTCQAGDHEEFCGGDEDVACTTSANVPGECGTTTGNAGYCTGEGNCFACSKDTDCREFCGPNAACLRCLGACEQFGGTACVGPLDCQFPT